MNAVMLGLLLIAVDEFSGEPRLWVIGELAVAAILAVIFVARERTRAAPILPVDLFRRPVFALSVMTSICSYTAQGTVYVALPFLFEDVGKLSQITTGLLMTPWPAIVVLVAPIAGRLSDRSSPGLLGAMGLGVMTVGMALLLTMPAHPGWEGIAWRMAVGGFGFGFFQSPNNRLLIGAAPPERSGGASGMLSTARLLGQTIGSALVAVMFGLGVESAAGIAAGVKLSLLAGMIAAGGATLVSFVRLWRMRERRLRR
jgi:DHA2 family multidrug resistance protein-like MFS transporter